MTRKDYELIAKVLSDADNGAVSEQARYGVRQVVFNLCDAFERENPSFNPAMWLAACRGE